MYHCFCSSKRKKFGYRSMGGLVALEAEVRKVWNKCIIVLEFSGALFEE